MSKLMTNIIGLLILVVANLSICYSQCQPLTPVPDKKIQYKNRGNRCEGFYSEVPSAHPHDNLKLVAAIRGKFNFTHDTGDTLKVTVENCPGKTINILAKPISQKVYYQMDTKIPENQQLTWPIGDVIFYAKILTPRNIGVIGWIETDSKKIYIPLTTKSIKSQIINDDNIRLTFVPKSNLDSVQYRYGKHDIKGNTITNAWRSINTPGLAGRPLLVTIKNDVYNILYIELGAKVSGTGEWINESVLVFNK